MYAEQIVDFASPPGDVTIEALLERQVGLEAELKRLAAVDKTRINAESLMAELDAEQAALDAAERTSWATWAQAAEGDPPKPQAKRRDELETRRRLTANDLSAALRAGQAVKPRIDALIAELQAIGDLIFAKRVAATIPEAREANARLHQSVDLVRADALRLYGLDHALAELGIKFQNDEPKAAAIASARRDFETIRQPPFAYTQADVIEASAAWLADLA
jgi:hypothetical protein